MKWRCACAWALCALALQAIVFGLQLPRNPLRRTTRLAASDKGGSWKYNPNNIRNFCIIAHVDHGKSTLADRLLELTQTVADREMQEQVLDNLSIERERGITIKLRAVQMMYTARSGENYLLNLIDTPGHVDFGYEVSRSLAACEGALLVVDAAQGVEAQTMANVHQALDRQLEVLPVLNKIDLPSADADKVATEVENVIGLDCSDALRCSAKLGDGVPEILEAIVSRLPAPRGQLDKPLRALVFDSYYDPYRGVVVLFRVVDGEIRKGDRIRFLQTSQVAREVLEVGRLVPHEQPVSQLRAGEVGYLCAAIKLLDEARVGETIVSAASKLKLSGPNTGLASSSSSSTSSEAPIEPLSDCTPPKPMVFAGLYPCAQDQLEALRDGLSKYRLNDAAFSFSPERSEAMGLGFRGGFLGLLHMEIVQERLEREFGLELVVTAPSVTYKAILRDGSEKLVECPSRLPDPVDLLEVHEPYAKVEIFTPVEYTGPLMELSQARRGELQDVRCVSPQRSVLVYAVPLAEMATDFLDQVKSRSRGYASMTYAESGYRVNDLVRVDIRINGEQVPPLACIVHRDKAFDVGKAVCNRLKESIPRQQFRVPIQACVGSKPIASAHISPLMKDVLAKCYGGDITRKKKLLQKQARGKKRMKEVGRVQIPQEAFMAICRGDVEG